MSSLPAVSKAARRKLSNDPLRRQLAFNELLREVLTRFAVCDLSEIDANVTWALAALARSLGVDHAHVILFSADRSTWSATHEWTAAHIQRQFDSCRDIPFGTLLWSESTVLAGGVIRINTLDDYPPEAAAERQRPDVQAGLQSLLLMPMYGQAGIVTGAMGVDSHARAVVWSDDDIARCKLLGDAIAGLLERKRAEQAARETNQLYRVMFENSQDGLMVASPDGGILDANPAACNILGYRLQELLGLTRKDLVDLSDPGLAKYLEVRERNGHATGELVFLRKDASRVPVEISSQLFRDPHDQVRIGLSFRDISGRQQAARAHMELAGRLMNAQESERTRIARELHDNIGQSLAVLGMQVQRAIGSSSGLHPPKPLDLQDLRKKITEIGNQVSQLSHQLHSSELEFLGLATAIKSLCREFSENYHIAVGCICQGIPAQIDGDVGLGFLRVIQEALHNVAKHSHARRVEVTVSGNGNQLTLSVSDDGDGFNPEKVRAGSGLGLISMRERIHLMGGEFTLSSTVGGGTRVEARTTLPEGMAKRVVAGGAG